MPVTSQRVDFPGSHGAQLSARLDLPHQPPRAYALFAHCFTCSKDLHASREISRALAEKGIAVLRFDFTGLGSSRGEFASTNFSSNVADLVAAAEHLSSNFEAPSLLIGHSLGGAAVLVAAARISGVRAVATIGAPADAAHVTQNFHADVEAIRQNGIGEVVLGGRKFTIEKQFLDDVDGSNVRESVAKMRKPLLVMHSPVDDIVGIENATAIFTAARHPKSFVSLDKAEHLLSRSEDAIYAAETIAAWAGRYLPARVDQQSSNEHTGITVTETGNGKFQNTVMAGAHVMLADEPVSYGGLDSGPSPYDYLSIALGACTTMTLRMYADRKGWDTGTISCVVDHKKIHARDCQDCSEDVRSSNGKIDHFHRRISIEKLQDGEMADKLLEIADKCPVHRTLHSVSAIKTTIEDHQ